MFLLSNILNQCYYLLSIIDLRIKVVYVLIECNRFKDVFSRPRPCARRRLSRVMWWCAVVCLLPSLQPPSGVFGPGPVGHPQNRSIVEGQIERDSVECLEYDDEFCCSSDDDDRPLARWLHFGRRDAPQPPRHSVRDNDEQLLVEGTMPLYLKQ